MAKVEGLVKKSLDIPNMKNNEHIPNVAMKQLKIREIFYSLQGEGGRSGEASLFIRLAYCNKNCWFCDTDWSFGDVKTVAEVANQLSFETIGHRNTGKYVGDADDRKDRWIVWTGGEPTLQLTEDIVAYFKSLGYKQAIETNGTNPVPKGIDYVVCSPKVKPDILNKNFPDGLDEIRYPYEEKKMVDIKKLPKATHYYVSPLFGGKEHERMTLMHPAAIECVEFVKNNPQWKLSIQIHKMIGLR